MLSSSRIISTCELVHVTIPARRLIIAASKGRDNAIVACACIIVKHDRVHSCLSYVVIVGDSFEENGTDTHLSFPWSHIGVGEADDAFQHWPASGVVQTIRLGIGSSLFQGE
jgi:hypothetical protein